MGACCGRLSDCLGRLSEKGGDSPEDTAKKRLATPVYLWVPVVVAVIYLSPGAFSLNPAATFWHLGMVTVFVALSTGFVVTLCSHAKPTFVASVLTPIATLGLLGIDCRAASVIQPRWWSLVVLVLDFALVMEVHDNMHWCVIGCTLAYLAVERAEAAARFGLYEAASGGTIEPRDMVWNCDCANPPCTGTDVGSVAGDWAGFAFVFLTDYMLTRGFAVGLRHQMALVDASVDAAERVAVLLAAYSVSEAEEVVTRDGESMPPDLRDALTLLLANLKSYRPYLPDSLLHQVREECAADGESDRATELALARVSPPGVDEGGSANVCLCFTDIQSSTALWEAHPQDMYDALQIHNKVVRSTAAANGGYECKTIGDAFMLCFASAEKGCQFALAAQLGLLHQHWPPDMAPHDLCRPRHCRETGALLWNGLRVRIGLNCGEARVQQNPITGRYDYFGGTVNVASRVEAAVQRGGLTGVTDAVLQALGDQELERLGLPVITPLGPKVLKGVQGPVELHVMLPQELAARAQEEEPDTPTQRSSPTSPCPLPRASTPDSPCGTHKTANLFAMAMQGPRRRSSASGARRETVRSIPNSQSAFESPSESPEGAHQPQLKDSPQRTVRAAVPKQLGAFTLLLSRAAASCAAVRVPLRLILEQEGRLAVHYAAIDSAADSSGGVVSALLSAGVVVSWGTAKPCAGHYRQCAHFVQTILRDPRTLTAHCGVASGEALNGNVAAGRRRFATVIGGCVELSTALAEEAELCGDAALVQGPAVGVFAEAGCAFRAQVWRNDALHPKGFVVWEITPGQDGLFPGLISQCSIADGHPEEQAVGIDGAFITAAELRGEEQLEVLRSLRDAAAAPADVSAATRLLHRAERGVLRVRNVAPLPWLIFEDVLQPLSL